MHAIKSTDEKYDLQILHGDGGLCSCMTVALIEIVKFAKEHEMMPRVDRSKQFMHHKVNKEEDITHRFFLMQKSREYVHVNWKYIPADVDKDCMSIQFDNYKFLDYANLNRYVSQYFTPSVEVFQKMSELFRYFESSEEIRQNCVTVCYRGNDKARETEVATYENFFAKCDEIQARRKDVKFIVLPDECTFKKAFKERYENSIFFDEVTCTDNRNSMPMFECDVDKRIERDQYFLAALLLSSMSSEIVTHSGNVGLWLSLYHKTNQNIHQIYNNVWYE